MRVIHLLLFSECSSDACWNEERQDWAGSRPFVRELTSAIYVFYKFLPMSSAFSRCRWCMPKKAWQAKALSCGACEAHSGGWMSCPLGGSSISRLLMYISGSSIGPSGLCMMDQYSCSTTNMDTATIFMENFKCWGVCFVDTCHK